MLPRWIAAAWVVLGAGCSCDDGELDAPSDGGAGGQGGHGAAGAGPSDGGGGAGASDVGGGAGDGGGGSPSLATCDQEGEILYEVLATSVSHFELEGPHLFWSEEQHIARRSIETIDDAVSINADDWQGDIYDFALDADDAYWIDRAEGAVRAAPKGGGGPIRTLFDHDQEWGWALALTDAHVFFLDVGGTVRKVDKAGASPSVHIASGPGDARDIATDATHVYWVHYEGVSRAPLADPVGEVGVGEPIATGQDRPYSLALDATYVYWINNGDGAVRKVKKDGTGGVVTLAESTADGPFGGGALTGGTVIALDGGYAYFGADVDDLYLSIFRVPVDGGEVKCVASDVPLGFAFDDTYFYMRQPHYLVRYLK